MAIFRRLSLFLALVLLGASAGAPLFGQSGVFDRTGGVPGHGAYSSVPEESVDLFTGNVMLRYLDYSLPGPNGLDVRIWRVYNSKVLKDRQSGNPSLQAERKSWVGIGWTLHMGRVHNYGTTTPIIEFPDGRFETAWPDNYGAGKNITRDFLRYDRAANKLYLQDGTVWTFGVVRTITKGDSSTEQVRLVTKIENTYGQSIDITYDSNRPSINSITDACGRVIDFVSTGTSHNNTKLTQMKVKDDEGNEVVYNYTVAEFANGYHKLTSIVPPEIPATAFEYYDGTNYRYEMTKVTTAYGGVLEFSYVNHNFVFNGITLDSRVASQKRITFNPGEQAKVWNFTYPSYSGVPTATATVEGPEYTTSVTHHGYDAASPWKIGLVSAKTVNDGSFSETYDWTSQELSNTTWMVLGTNMGTAKGPLVASVIRTPLGDAASKQEYLYERDETKKYGLPTKVKLYVNGAANPKNYRELSYYYEVEGGGEGEFFSRYMLGFIHEETLRSGAGALLAQTKNYYYAVAGKYGALLRVERLKTPPSTYLVWNYGYTVLDSGNPSSYYISVDPPPAGGEDASAVYYSYGMPDKVQEPGYTASERVISVYDSSILSEKNAFGTEIKYEYDVLGRIDLIDLPDGEFNDIDYEWRPNGENKAVITQGSNIVTKYWDGMGRDTGSTEEGDGIILYYRKALDAEGRVKEENRASVNAAHKHAFLYKAAGQITRVTDPLSEITNISYSGITRTITDAESHTTTHEYNDLPGSITKLTDAQGKIADYTYDAAGRLATVVFNGTRTQSYQYDHLTNVISETHPETGTISYTYNDSNRISGRTWGGTEITYAYDTKGRLASKTTAPIAETVTYSYSSTSGRISSITSSKGWSRTEIGYNKLGALARETVTIPGLSTSKTIHYTYDGNNNLESVTYPDGRTAEYSSNGLNAPETAAFNGSTLVDAISYGPGKAVTSMNIVRNGTVFSSLFNAAGMPTTVSLVKGAGTLYNATYAYDGVGNITGISSTAPALNAVFGYDSLNRLTSAAYSSGRAASYSYDYDEYGNMKTVRENGLPVFDKTYDTGNRINGFSYDSRGNLLSSGGNNYIWDSQNRLDMLTNPAGDILGKYLYDDSGLRLRAIPAEPEIEVSEGGKPVYDGGFVDFYATVGSQDPRTFTITNSGDASLALGGSPIITITGADAGDFDVLQQPSSPVAPFGGTTTFIIQFDPQTTGVKEASISIASNDADEGSYEITLHGYNGPPEIDIPEAPDGGTFDYGTCAVGDYIVQTFTIENVGDAPLYLDGNPYPVTLTGQHAGQFQIDCQPGTTIEPGQYTEFEVRFEPTSTGQKTALLYISNNDSDEDPYEITITGYGEMGPLSMGLSVTSPNGQESFKPGSSQTIAWSAEETVKALKVEYSLDNGSSYLVLAARADNTGSFPWQVPYVLSPACLVRATNADGYPLRPEVVSFELKFRVECPEEALSPAAHLRLRLQMPDTKSQSVRTAELSFFPDAFEGAEYLDFNQTRLKAMDLKAFRSAWHRLQVLFDLNLYSGTLLLDGQAVLKDIPLEANAWVDGSAELTVSCDRETSASVWVDDLELKLQDASLRPEESGALLLLPVAKDGFEGYKSEDFPLYGGWTTSQALLDEGAPLPIVDRTEYASGMQSLRLGNGDGRGSLISKRFALPERVPFDTSNENFAIANELRVITTGRASALERNSGERASDRERNRGSRTSRQKPVKRGSADEAGAVSSRAAQAFEAQGSSATEAKAGTLSASTPGGSFYIYSITGVLLAEYNRYDQPVRDNIYVGNRLLAEFKHAENKTYFYQQDQINSTRIVTDEAGTVVYSAAHDPYGGIQQTWVNTFDPAPKFSGKERDGESGLDYFGARYYDRAQYRFVSVDQLYIFHSATFNPQHLNNYSFCWNNPTSNYDPDGREPTKITIVRTSFTAEYVQGYVLLNGESTGIHTLELPWKNNAKNASCIKGGIYKAELVYSTELGVDVIRLEDKNDRAGILIHGGASTEDTDGCILVGLGIGTAPGTLVGGPDARQQIIDYCNSSGWSPTAGVSGLVAWAEAYFAYCQDVLAWQREEITVEVTISPQLVGQIALSIVFFAI